MKYYPAFLNLKNKKAVVIGGGKVAERKIRSLLRAGASVTVVSPDITKAMHKLRGKGSLTHVRRNYRKGDLKKAFIVFACTSSPEINTIVARDAEHLVNVVDTPDDGNFIVPSNVKRGPLTIAISTEGASPAMSKAIRGELEELYDREFARYLKFLTTMRSKALKEIRDDRNREMFLKSLASQEVLTVLRRKGFNALSGKILKSLNNMKQDK